MKRHYVLAGLLCAMFMTAVEATVVATAMPSVIADLGGVSLYGWVSAVYLLASTVTVPLYGKLADLRGRKPVMLFGLILFLVGSAASGAATNIAFLIAARAIQGLGAGATQPTTIIIAGDLYSVEERGRLQGWFGSVWAIAGAVGPLLGGFFVATLSWRWVFWFNLPFGLVAYVILWRHFHDAREPGNERMRLDWIGVVSMTAAAVAILTFAERRATMLSLTITVVATIVFVVNDRRAPDPLVPLRLFADRFIAVSMLVSFCIGALMIGHLTYAPLYVQGVLGRPPSQAGSALAPMLVCWPIASAVVGRNIRRFGFRMPVVAGAVVAVIGGLILAVFLPSTRELWPIVVASGLLGVGMGMSNVCIIVALQSSVSWEQRGVVTALNMFTRSMGAALCVGGLGALLTMQLSRVIDPERVSGLLSHERVGGPAHDFDSAIVDALASSFAPLAWTLAALTVSFLVLAVAYRPPSTASAAPPLQAIAAAE